MNCSYLNKEKYARNTEVLISMFIIFIKTLTRLEGAIAETKFLQDIIVNSGMTRFSQYNTLTVQ